MAGNHIDHAALALEDSRGDLEKKWLTFWLEQQLFGVSIANVEQIVSMQPITEVPEYPAFAKGIISLRGAMIPVIDLRIRLGKPELAYTEHTCIVIVSVGEEHIGFIVDEVDAVIDIPAEAIAPPPRMGEEGVNRYLTGIAQIARDDGSESVVLCLDATRVLLEAEFQALGLG